MLPKKVVKNPTKLRKTKRAPTGPYWNARTRAFWYAPNRSAVPWKLVDYEEGDGGTECEACGHEHIVREFYVESPGRQRSVVGSICVNKVNRFSPEFSELGREVSSANRSMNQLANRRRAEAILTDPVLVQNQTFTKIMADHLAAASPLRGNLLYLNKVLKSHGLKPLGPLGPGSTATGGKSQISEVHD